MTGDYAFTVSIGPALRNPDQWYVDIQAGNEGVIDEYGPFLTREEADTHAALILAALHEAVME